MQLAVVAHIRHVYTDYDRLLRITHYLDARARIEKPCLDKLAQWRRDDDDDPDAMEEILREVIVIDDDDEDEDEDKRNTSFNDHQNNRDDSVEIISSHAFADVQMPAVNYSTPRKVAQQDRHHYGVERDGGEMVQDVSQQAQPFTPPFQHDPPRFNRTSVHHHRWQEALHSHRMNQAPVPMVYNAPLLQENDNSRREPLLRSETGLNPRSTEPRATHLEPMNYDRYTQPQDASNPLSLPIRLKDGLANRTTRNKSGGPKDSFIESGQVSKSTMKLNETGQTLLTDHGPYFCILLNKSRVLVQYNGFPTPSAIDK